MTSLPVHPSHRSLTTYFPVENMLPLQHSCHTVVHVFSCWASPSRTELKDHLITLAKVRLFFNARSLLISVEMLQPLQLQHTYLSP